MADEAGYSHDLPLGDNYEVYPGLREKAQIIVHDGGEGVGEKLWLRDKCSAGKFYLKCRRYGSCNAKAVIKDGHLQITSGEHSCDDDKLTAEVLKLRKTVREKAKAVNADLRQLYDESVEECDPRAAGHFQFDEAQQSMKTARKKWYPSKLKTAEEVESYFENYPESPIFKFHKKSITVMSNGKEEKAILLASPDLVASVGEETTQFMLDATFKTTPPGFYQAFTVAGEVDGVTSLLFVALMTKKVQSLYVKVLEAIRDDHPGIQPKFITADFEAAITAAACEVFPEADIKGCLFHFNDSLNRKARSPGI